MTAGPGFCVWFTGLSGAGKSATARALEARLTALGRTVTLLDGDEVRSLLSSDLGYSRDERATNIRRIAFVAREVVRHGGAAVVAAISPYEASRSEARATIGAGAFVEVFVDTPIEICERRDPKGLYGRARAGDLPAFTGISDPYERPDSPDLVIRGVGATADQNAREVIGVLSDRGLLPAPAPGEP
jgi:sulfate adenylyltransferase